MVKLFYDLFHVELKTKLNNLNVLSENINETNIENYSIVITGVLNLAIGHDHMLLLTSDHKIIAIGNNSHKQCECPVNFSFGSNVVLKYLENSEYLQFESEVKSVNNNNNNNDNSLIDSKDHQNVMINKLCAGLRHSVAVTSFGEVITWGDTSYGQVSSERCAYYYYFYYYQYRILLLSLIMNFLNYLEEIKKNHYYY